MTTPETHAGQAVRSTPLLEFRMSNAELADAITAAYNRAGTANEDQRIQQEHLKALLAVQLGRAQAVVADYSTAAGERIGGQEKPHE